LEIVSMFAGVEAKYLHLIMITNTVSMMSLLKSKLHYFRLLMDLLYNLSCRLL